MRKQDIISNIRTGLVYTILAAVLVSTGYFVGNHRAGQVLSARQTQFASQAATAPFPELNAANMAALVNKERATAGLPALTYNAQLEASACAKADDMITKGYWSHTAPDFTTGWDFMDRAGYRYLKAGENLAYGQRSDTAVVNGWVNSPTHQANIVGPYTEQGMCVRYGDFHGGKNAVVVNHFGAPR